MLSRRCFAFGAVVVVVGAVVVAVCCLAFDVAVVGVVVVVAGALGTCAGPGFVIGVASPFFTLEVSACSCIWRLFGLISVASDGLGGAAAIDEGGGSEGGVGKGEGGDKGKDGSSGGGGGDGNWLGVSEVGNKDLRRMDRGIRFVTGEL